MSLRTKQKSVWSLSLSDFLSDTASAQPTPGGGSVASASAALGLGLVIMALEISLKRKNVEKANDICILLSEARILLSKISETVEADINVFNTYMSALKLPKETEEQKKLRNNSLQAASLSATKIPLNAADLFLSALRIAQNASALAHHNVLSDVLAGTSLLEGSVRAILFNVDINLSFLNDTNLKASYGKQRITCAREGAQLAADILNLGSLDLLGNSTIIEGSKLLENTIQKSRILLEDHKFKKVAIILFGQDSSWDPAAYQAYRISTQEKLHNLVSAGFSICSYHLQPTISAEEFELLLKELNCNEKILAISVQMPIPSHLVKYLVCLGDKDLDAVQPDSHDICAVAEAALRLIHPWKNKGVAVVGAKGFVGSAICRRLQALQIPILPLDKGDDLLTIKEMACVISTANSPEILDARHIHFGHEIIVDIGFCPIGRDFRQYVGSVSRAAYGIPKRMTITPGCMGPLAMTILIERLIKRAVNTKLSPWSFSDNCLFQ